MQNRNDDGPIKLPKGINFWSQPFEEPLLKTEAKSKKLVQDFLKVIREANTQLSASKFDKDNFEKLMKGNFAKIANLYYESVSQCEVKEVRDIQKQLEQLQKKITQSKPLGQEISEILTSLESKEAKKIAESPTNEEIEKIINDFSLQIDALTKELNRLFQFSTSLETKHGSATFKQGKDVIKSSVDKVLQQLTQSFVKLLAEYSKVFPATDSEQRELVSTKLSGLHQSAIDLTNLFNDGLQIKPIYTIDSALKKKASDIVEVVYGYLGATEKLGYVPPDIESKAVHSLQRPSQP